MSVPPQDPEPAQRAAATGDALPASVRYGFAIGDFGFNLYWQGLGLFLIYFQTDVLGIPTAWAGICYLVASVWDGLTDPVMGVIADRTRTRWGRYRPFLLFGSLPLAFAFVLTFSAPHLPLAWLVAYSLLAQLLVRALYTSLAIPYSSLSVAITRDSIERTRLTGLRMQCAFLGGVAVAYLMPELALRLGTDSAHPAYGSAAGVIGALATGAFVLCFLAVREPPEAQRPPRPAAPLVPDALAFARVVRGSGPLLRVLLGKFLVTFTLTMHTRNLVYYVKYVLGEDELVRYVLPLLTAASVLSVPLWVRVIRRHGKRGAWIGGSLATAACGLVLQLPTVPPLPLAIALLAAFAAATTAYGVCFWAMLPDTVEYNELHFQRRDEAKVFGVASFTQKIAMGLSAAVAGLYLDGSGFLANHAQGAASIDAIRTTMGVIPAAGALLSIFVMSGYGLDDDAHRRILRALDEGARKPREAGAGRPNPATICPRTPPDPGQP